MKRLGMLNLWLSSIALILVSCSTNSYKKLSTIGTITIDSSLFRPFIKESHPAPLFKTTVDLYGKSFGGLLLIKYMPDSSYRIVFTTETGIKLFDFELKGEQFKVQYCIEKFNKEAVLNTICNDIKLVLLENKINKTATLLRAPDNKQDIYKFSNEKEDDYYFFDRDLKQVTSIEQSSGKKKKLHIALNNYHTAVPAEIMIVHKTIRLKIELNLIER